MGAKLIGEIIFKKIKHLDFDCIGGPTLGADPIVSAVSIASALSEKPVPGFYVRKEAKSHGTMKMIEGIFKPGNRVIIVEDVVTTGASTLKIIKAVENERGKKFAVTGTYKGKWSTRQRRRKETLLHEEAHAFFYVNPKYREDTLEIMNVFDFEIQSFHGKVYRTCTFYSVFFSFGAIIAEVYFRLFITFLTSSKYFLFPISCLAFSTDIKYFLQFSFSYVSFALFSINFPSLVP